MELTLVYLVGWQSKTLNTVFGVFENYEDAKLFKNGVSRNMAPCGSDFDGSFIAQCPYFKEWVPAQPREPDSVEFEKLLLAQRNS